MWDYRNRLIEVKEKQSGNWVTVGEYKYDARTRRVLKVVTNKGGLNGTTRFLWGGDSDWQCVEERSGDGDLVARYTYAPGYIDAVAVQERDLNDDQDFGDANEVVYYHSNTLFSVYALTDAGEDAVERYRYDAYGAATVLDADWAADADGLSDVDNPYTFTGRRLDAESGLMEYRQRKLSTATGRFVSRDPLAYTQQMGLYVYVAARATRYSDPYGLYGEETHYGLTLELASSAGLSGPCAQAIASGNQDVDIAFPAHGAAAELWAWLPGGISTEEAHHLVWSAMYWHFPGAWNWPPAKPNQPTVQHGSEDSMWYINMLKEKGNCSCYLFGMALHPYQDSWAHEGIPPLGIMEPHAYGHDFQLPPHWYYPWQYIWPSFLTHDADIPNLRPEYYEGMGNSTYDRMRDFLNRCPCHGQPVGDFPAPNSGGPVVV